MDPMLLYCPPEGQSRQGPYRSLRQAGRLGLMSGREMSVLHKDFLDTHKTHGQFRPSVIHGQEECPAKSMSPGGLAAGDVSLLPVSSRPKLDDKGAGLKKGDCRVAD